MRRFTILLLAFATTSVFTHFAAGQAATTIPVGFNTVTLPAAASASAPSSSVVSVPFYAVATFTGAVSSVDSATQLSVSGANFTGTLTTPPYLARLKTGPSTGRFFIVTGQNTTQLTLDTATAGYTLTTGAPSNTQAQVSVGDSVEVLPASTLGTLFGTSTVPFKTGTPDIADNLYLFTGSSYDLYYHNNGAWRKSGNLNTQNNTVVLPDRGIFIVRRETAPLPLTFLGTVPSTTERTDFPGPGSSFKSTRFPVDMTLGGGALTALNLQNLSGWIKDTDPNVADNLYLWNGTSWDLYFHNNTSWRKSGNLQSQDTTVIPIGTTMFVIRKSSASGAASTFVKTLPYTL